MKLITITLALAALLPLTAEDKKANVLLQAAQAKETVQGDLKGAIELYGQAVKEAGANRALAAKTLVQMGECYQKMGDTESGKIYERVVREYADQKEAVAEARARLGGGPAANNAGIVARQITGVSADWNSSVSPDGRYLTFTNWNTGDLAVRDLSNGVSRNLTNTGGWEASGDYHQGSVISPDSRQIAYSWFVEKAFNNEVRILPLSGGDAAQPRIVHRSEGRREYVELCAWSPDGKQLLVVRSLPDRTSQIAMLSIQDGSMRVLKSFGWQTPRATLSPDGRYIAYDAPASDKVASRDIFVLAVDGSRETVVAPSPSNDVSPFWSPDGSQILFFSERTANRSLWRAPIEGGRPNGPAELLKADIGPISPLGITRKGVLYYLPSGPRRENLYVAELDRDMKATRAPVLATEEFINSNSGPEWSPDGQSLAYYSVRSPTALIIRLVKTGEERKVPQRLRIRSIFGAGPKWFPDGRSVLVPANEGQRPGIGFYRVDLTTGDAELLHHNANNMSSFDLSPDGKTIFYVEGVDNGKAIVVQLMRFDIESRRESILKQGQWFIALSVSPDGAQVAYLVSHRPGSASSVSVMPSAGGEPREVFRGAPWMDGSRYNTLAWTPDGRSLMFARGEVGWSAPTVLWRVPVPGGAPERMGISTAGQLKSPRMHPDGRRIVFGVFERTPNEVWVLENFLPTLSAKK